MPIFRQNETAATIERRLADLTAGLQAAEGQRADVRTKLDAAIAAGGDTEKHFTALALVDSNLAARQDVLARVAEELAAAQQREQQDARMGTLSDFEVTAKKRLADIEAARSKLLEGTRALLSRAEKFDALVAGVLTGAPAALGGVELAKGSASALLVAAASAPGVEDPLTALLQVDRELSGDLAGFAQRLAAAISAARSAAAY